jgi:RNA polymerase II subunit A small phosphatase-like protein
LIACASTRDENDDETRLIDEIVTSTPHPPSSSTQTTSTVQNTSTTDDSESPVLSTSQNEKDFLGAADEGPVAPKKNRGLLHVPSRSSSHKIQPSPTSTGLSGVTISDPRESIGGRSKESKGSILGRRRNGSTTSSKMSITPPGPADGLVGSTNPIVASGAVSKQPKKKGFLSFLCCGVPDSANALDPGASTAPANRITKVPSGRPTTASRPDQQMLTGQSNIPAQPETEKDALLQDNSPEPEAISESKEIPGTDPEPVAHLTSVANGDLKRTSSNSRDQPLPNLPKDETNAAHAGPSNQTVMAQSNSTEVDEIPEVAKDAEGDVKMNDSDPLAEEGEYLAATRREEGTNLQVLPPPPPVPQQPPNPNEVVTPPEAAEQKQQWLLPPIAPRFQGKKCLVLDLDETLVHSSFKASNPQIRGRNSC